MFCLGGDYALREIQKLEPKDVPGQELATNNACNLSLWHMEGGCPSNLE